MGVKSFILKGTEFTDSGRFVNKFMSLERALNLLNSKSIWFANPSTWPDPYEKRFIIATYGSKKKFAWKDRVFCSCFTDNATSEASWNAYSSKQDCIQFTFYRQALIDLLNAYQAANKNNQVYFDPVEYMQTKYIEKPLSKIPFDPPISPGIGIRSMEFKERLLLLKRKAFEYENEFRAIIVKPKTTKELGIQVPIPDIHTLIHEITIGPKVEKDTFEMIKGVLEHTYGFSSAVIKQSFLYKKLPNTIEIKM